MSGAFDPLQLLRVLNRNGVEFILAVQKESNSSR